MRTSLSLKKYYIGITVLILIAFGFLVYTITQSGGAKKDRATNAVVESIGDKLDNNISDKNRIPVDLAEAGITKMPPSVTYTRLSDSQYKICFYYYQANNGLDADWSSIVTAGLNSTQTGQSDHSYFDSSLEFSHKKGQNCQTVKPVLFDSTFSPDPSTLQ